MKAIVIGGMTGIGKSKAAALLAQKLNGVIICGDGVQLNKGLDVLTNKQKVNAPLMQSHYTLTDKLDSHVYTKNARAVIIKQINAEKVPIIEGGSFFYIRHLFEGHTDLFTNESVF